MSTSDKKVNNWEAAKSLDRFEEAILLPLKARIDKANKLLADKNYKWKDEATKNRAIKQVKKLNEELDTLYIIHGDFKEMVKQHERLTTSVTEWYAKWSEKVAYKGKQPFELMEPQTKFLQEIFTDMYKTIEPLDLPVKKPE